VRTGSGDEPGAPSQNSLLTTGANWHFCSVPFNIGCFNYWIRIQTNRSGQYADGYGTI